MPDRLTRGLTPWLLLVILCAGLFLPGLGSLPPMDRDEARFAQATRQMIESGDYLDIRFQDEARNKKPVGIYWLQAAFVGIVGDAEMPVIWPFRLASTAGATLAVLLTFGLGSRLFDRRTAFTAAVLLACTLMVTVEAHLAKTDAVLLATSAAGQGALGLLYARRRRIEMQPTLPATTEGWRLPLLFWAAEGVAVLIKGPVVPMIGLLTILALVILDRRVRWLGALRAKVGLPVMLAIFLPWLVAIQVTTHGAFLSEAVGHDMLGKLGGAQESHGGWPGYYALMIFVTFWPASFLLLPGLVQGWRERADPAIRFLAAWLVPAWMVFELAPTKLPHYTLPLYPALALLAARGLLAGGDRLFAPGTEGAVLRRRWVPTVGVTIWVAVSVLLAVALIVLPIVLRLVPPLAAIMDAVLLLAAAAFVVQHLRGRPVPLGGGRSLVFVAVAALAVLPATLGATLPRLDPIWLSRSIAATHPAMPLVAVGYTEPSLVFLLGTAINLIVDEGAADILAKAGGGSALVADKHQAGFRQSMEARGFRLEPLAQFHGFDYSTGHWMDLTLDKAVRR